MDTPDDLPPEGHLLEQAREPMPQNEAARRAGMSGTRWRQIVERDAPSMRSKRGVERLAVMSQIVGVTPEQWEQVNRSDIAERLRATAESGPDQELTLSQAKKMLADLQARVARLEGEKRETGS